MLKQRALCAAADEVGCSAAKLWTAGQTPFPRAKKKNAFPGLRKCERRINREDRYQICSDAVFGGIELGALTRLLPSHSDQTDRNNMSRERKSAAGVSACRSGGRVPLNFSFAQSSFLMA